MKARLLLALVLALVLVVVVAAPASAHAKKPLECRVDMAVGTAAYADHWGGTIRGDVRGTMEIWELPWYDQGPVLYTFAENFKITAGGGEIKGFEMGIWYPDATFTASGWVTEATGRWKNLVGWMFYYTGTTVFVSDTQTTIPDGRVTFLPPLGEHWRWMRY
jgi:hypothetical protein